MTVDLTKMCEISNVVRVFYIVKILFKIVCILVPTILIIVTGIDLFKFINIRIKMYNGVYFIYYYMSAIRIYYLYVSCVT